jgi:hypothetical protein
MNLKSQLLERLRQEDPLNPGVQGQPREHRDTPSQKKKGKWREHMQLFSVACGSIGLIILRVTCEQRLLK